MKHIQSTFVALLGLTCLVVGQGCGPTHHETLIGPLPPSGTRSKVVYPLGLNTDSSSQAGGGQKYIYKWDCGKFNFEVVDERLKVDGQDYGALKAGDSVVIDGRGKLKIAVNDVERKPVENPVSD